MSTAVPEGERIRLQVETAPTTHALLRLLTTLRGRGTTVLDLHWEIVAEDNIGRAALLIEITAARQQYLIAVVERVVGVRRVARTLL